MGKTNSENVQARWSIALLVVLVVALSWSTIAHAQTPADSAYGSPLSPAGSEGEGSAENSGLEATPEGAVDSNGTGSEASGTEASGTEGSGTGSEGDVNGDPALEVLPDTGGASLLLGSAVALMLVGTGILAVRQIRR